MAEGWTRFLKKDTIEAYSAGVEIHGLNPLAVQVMAESGVDISHQKSKHVDDVKAMELDAVITVCDHAQESCPYFPPRCKVIHIGFDDPPALARKLSKTGAGREEQLDCYRRVRDEIKTFVQRLPDNLDLIKEK